MIIYPAIDIRAGKVVRLREGDPTQQTIFADEPIAVAARWLDAGAEWLHVVNLDGAFGEQAVLLDVVEAMAKLGAKVQMGGGLRDRAAIDRTLNAGVTRAVVGTLAVNQPDVLGQAIEDHGQDALCAALDARGDTVVTRGWQQASALTPVDLGRNLYSHGVRHALFTDVGRDGLLSGVNVAATEHLAEETGLSVIASGGISSLDDVERLAKGGLVAGAVVGMALYTGNFTLGQALEAAQARAKGRG